MSVGKALVRGLVGMASASILVQSLVAPVCIAAAADVRQARITLGAGRQAGTQYVIPCGSLVAGGGAMSSASYVIETGCGATQRAVVSAAQPMASSARFELGGNRPNPFVTRTAIYYQLPAAMTIQIEIFDLTGRLIRSIRSGEQGPGWKFTTWDGVDQTGRQATVGLYLYRLVAGSTVVHGRMVKLE